MRPIGAVSLVQLQPSGLIIVVPEPALVRSVYDASRRVEVDRLKITPRGIEATLPSGESIVTWWRETPQ